MYRWLYTGFFYLMMPLVLLRLLWRASKAPAYRQRVGERFGRLVQTPAQGGIWVHSVSVGETIAAAPLIRWLQQRYPGQPITVTTMTPTGSERVKALFGDSVFHCYIPYDLPGPLQRFLSLVRPQTLVIMETELWPNMLHYARRAGCEVILANARLSERSAAGYGRIGGLTRSLLGDLSLVAAQSEADGQRFLELGLAPDKLEVTGSIKFDISIDAAVQAEARQWRDTWQAVGKNRVWVAASTHAGEDEIILEAHRRLLASQPDALLVLVPRHPERFEQVAQLCERAGFATVRRSADTGASCGVCEETQVLLGDTMGELMRFLGTADLAFVGGTLVDNGGHNFLEPAAWGVPVLSGNSLYNFQEISEKLQAAGAMTVAGNGDELSDTLLRLAGDPELRERQSEAAIAVVDANRGALQRLQELIEGQVDCD